MTGKVAGVVERSVELAMIAVFTPVLDTVSTLLGGCAVVVALVEDKYAIAVHFAVDDVAVVADLAIVDDAVAAAPDVDAYWLVSCAFLPWFTENATAQRLQCGIPASSTRYQ